jgi:hypothetical protein
MIRTFARRVAVGLTTAAVAATAVALAPAPASAAPVSGLGYSAQWHYFKTDAFAANLKLPGAQLYASVHDTGSARFASPYVIDTDPKDGLCVHAWINDGSAVLGEALDCDQDKPVVFVANVGHGDFWMFLEQVKMVDGVPKPTGRLGALVVRDAERDPTLRTVGTGVSWAYYNDTDFELKMNRPEAALVAYGTDHGGVRTVVGTLENTAKTAGCASSLFWGLNGQWPVQNCQPGTTVSLPSMTIDDGIGAHDCFTPKLGSLRCLDAFIYEPV